jgi:CRISPR-associated protein Cas8a1/Csx13
MLELPPRLLQASKPDKKGEEPGAFWADSVVRPLIAENLARGRPWFEDFRSLMVAPDGKTDESRVRFLSYEREGLTKMIENTWPDDDPEKLLVEAVHDAMRQRFASIWSDRNVSKDAKAKRSESQKQRWRLALAGAKTPDDVRNALTDMWSRSVMGAPSNKVLKESWRDVLHLLCDEARWKLNRDLALLALASYSNPKADEQSDAVDDET